MTIINRRNLLASGSVVGAAALLGLTVFPPARRADAEQLTVEDVLFDPDNPVLGNPQGDVTIVEFFDYQCPYCKANHPELMNVVEEDGNIRLVLKDWPIFGSASVRASQLALGAVDAGVYVRTMEALMQTQGRLTEQTVVDALTQAGLDPAALDASYRAERDKWDGLLSRNSFQATELGLRGTPAFIVSTSLYAGSMNSDELRDAVAKSRQ